MQKKSVLSWIALVLVLIGGLNWGLVGLGRLLGNSGWDLVQIILASMPVVANIVYVVVGIAALYIIYEATMK